jgi:hypothetical protein
MGWLSKKLGIDDLREEVYRLRMLIEDDYLLILDGENGELASCHLNCPSDKRGFLIRGTGHYIHDSVFNGGGVVIESYNKGKPIDTQEEMEEWEDEDVANPSEN